MSDIVNKITDAATQAQATVAQVADAVAPVATQVAQAAEAVATSPVVEQIKTDVAPVVAAVQTAVEQVKTDVAPVVAEVKAQGFFSKIIAKILSLFKILK